MSTPYPVAPQPLQKDRTGDRVVSWILYVLLLLGEVVLATFSLFSVFATDSCGTSSNDPKICDGNYFAGLLLGFWGLLGLLAVAVPILMVVAIARKRATWPYPLVAIVIAGLSLFLYFGLLFA